MSTRASRSVLVDADVLGRARTGDETYVTNLLAGLPGLDPALRVLAATRRPDLVPPGVEAVALRARSQVVRMAVRLPRLLARVAPDLAHFQYVIPPGWRGRAVVTVHDLSFEWEPGLFSARDRVLLRTLVPRAVRRADHVLTVSEWTRRDLVERYGAAPDRVTVVHNGVGPSFGPAGPRPDCAPYVLFVGALTARKDPCAAVEAVARIEGLDLVMAGPDRGMGREVRRTAERLGVGARVRLVGHVPVDDLAALYRGAACVVLPSRFEGFGLPVVEAMASGAPVVTTTAAAIPEVAGDAAVLVPAGDPAALADGMVAALRDRDRLVVAGLARAALFSWADASRRTLGVYRGLLG